MRKCKEQLQQYASQLELALEGYIPQCPEPEDLVAKAMAYSLLGGGKRVRGALLLAFYSLYKDNVKAALPFASALEMIHAYSLIHDDLPCMDDDELRRGKPSCHIAFGEATALLAGDALLTLAFETVTSPHNIGDFAAATVLEATQALAAAAGCRGMIGGQIIDLEQEGKEGDKILLDRMYAKKTGALMTASAEIGSILGGASREETDAAVDYCRNIGLAFQIVDDLLDIEGDAATLGKPIGSDSENKKCTYVSLYGEKASREKIEECNVHALKALEKLPGDTSFLAWVADYLAGRKN